MTHTSRALFFVTALILAPLTVGAAEIDDRRKTLIQNLISAKIFYKVTQPGAVPHVWAGPAFNQLSFDDKQRFVSVVYAYAYCQGKQQCQSRSQNALNIVIVKDYRTGKSIGTFSPVLGGLSLD